MDYVNLLWQADPVLRKLTGRVDEKPKKKRAPGAGRPPIPEEVRKKRRPAMFLTDAEYAAVLALIERLRKPTP